MSLHFARSCARLLLPFLSLLLVACSGHRPPPEGFDEAALKYRAAGYQPAMKRPTREWQATWALNQTLLDVAWVAPQPGASAAPLILYLPGLGEPARGGELWRRAWAEAGYAVLSLQMPDDGRAVYSSAEAQAGAFRALAQRHFSPAALQARLNAVRLALAEVRRRAQAGDPAFAGVDTSRLLVAGFDLGAQTAAALAGERDADEQPALSPAPLAAILLSPYVEAQRDPARFARIAAPLLSITGPQDEDPLSWQPALQRQALWAGVQAPGSYQLLAQAGHMSLSGSAPERHAGTRDEEGGRGPGGPGMGGPPPSLAYGDEGGERRGDDRRGGPGGRQGPRGFGAGERIDYRQVAAIQAVSLAFLDASVRGSIPAQQWLQQAAPSWLGRQATLQVKPLP
jgi:hypothetical protein